MNKRNITLVFLFVTLILSAQDGNKEQALITETIENYFYGYLYGDSDKLNKAFDMENGAMKVVSKSDIGKEVVENIYFTDLIPRWVSREKFDRKTTDNSSLEILNIDEENAEIASAKIRMQVGEKVYIDILSLHKINGDWKITNKIFLVAD